MKHIHHLIILFLPVLSFGQLITGGNNVQEIVLQSLSGSGITIYNVSYTGNPDAIAYFSADNYIMELSSGLLMTTGSKYHALGPNNKTNAGINQQEAGSSLIEQIYPGSISYDAAVIEFDFVPTGSALNIQYQFGSEEYPEFSSQEFNDAFCILISGNEYSQAQNIAKLPNQSSICVNNINSSNNSAYYMQNGDISGSPYNSDPHYLQYDALIKPLIATTNVTPGLTYHLTMIIADLKDAIYDSGVFIQEGSITASLGKNTLYETVNVSYNLQTQQAKIELTEQQENLSYSIVDLSGKVMTQSKISETTPIDMSNYSSGMYLIHVEGNNGKITKKVIR